jgi:ribosome-associated protein
LNPRQLAEAVASALNDKRGVEVKILDLGDLRSFTDFFVIAGATSDRHARTLADAVVEAARKVGERTLGLEGEQVGRWILIDLGDVVVHVLQQDAREYYGLERLWGEAEAVAWPLAAGERR